MLRIAYRLRKGRAKRMAKWMLRRKSADFMGISKKFNIDPLLARLLVNRGITTDTDFAAYLDEDKGTFNDPFLLKDMELAVDIIIDKLNNNEHIRIVGDYDVDGVCASAIFKKGLSYIASELGSSSIIDVYIPHRIKDGYGLNMNIIENARDDQVDMILTCDNGISAVNEIARAVEFGIDVVITDHHEVPYKLVGDDREYIIPEALAVVDPKQEDCEYPFKGICGAFVAYKLIEAVLMSMDANDEILEELSELAAIATVADIMELVDENRILVKQGLKKLENSRNIGIQALKDVTGLSEGALTTFSLGFVIGPCINAAGRIDSATRSLELLLSQNRIEAMNIATDIRGLNETRKKLTDQAVAEADKQIEENGYQEDRVLVIFIPDCHESVAGIVAGKIKEKYMRPALVITKAEQGVKGSGRSIEAYHLYDELTKVSDIFIKYGGHSQAAGFSLPEEKVDELRNRLNENCTLTDDEMRGIIRIDADPPFSYCTHAFMKELDKMEPVGQGNENCMFARKNVSLVSAKTFGENGIVGKYKMRDTDGIVSELTLFRKNDELKKYLEGKYGEEAVKNAFNGRGEVQLSVAYYPKWNEYQGRKSVQLIIEDYC